MVKEEPKKEPQQEVLSVNSGTFVGSLYSQIVSVTITDVDITFEFVFMNPRDKKGQVVTRVTMPRPAGEDLAKTILNTIKMHETHKKGHKNA